ncbi:MAG: hypothetical protein SWK90_12460 [Chloroflexota bacterium]|nr:hypothetical protein [Chloroflexota bacterium]
MNFAEVERVVVKLRQDVAAGRLTGEQFKARLREMMVQDEHGDWWMVGYETGEWYRHDGSDWVPERPPGRAAAETYTPARVTDHAYVGWGFWLPWVVVTAVGGGVGGIVGGGINASLGDVANGAVGWAVVGAAIGVAQGVLLQRRIHRAGWWILVSILGWAAGAPIGFSLFGAMGGYAAAGALIGGAQWFVLRGQVQRAGVWVPASIVGWGVGGLVGWVVSAAVTGAVGGFWGFSLGWAVGWAVGGAMAGAILGIPLIWLLQQPSSET